MGKDPRVAVYVPELGGQRLQKFIPFLISGTDVALNQSEVRPVLMFRERI